MTRAYFELTLLSRSSIGGLVMPSGGLAKDVPSAPKSVGMLNSLSPDAFRCHSVKGMSPCREVSQGSGRGCPANRAAHQGYQLLCGPLHVVVNHGRIELPDRVQLPASHPQSPLPRCGIL